MKNLTTLLAFCICLIFTISCRKENCYECSQEKTRSSIDSSTYISEWEICDGWPTILNKVAKAEDEGAACKER